MGAVASFGEVSTPLGRARAWIRQCLVCKCLESCVAALLEEERLVKVGGKMFVFGGFGAVFSAHSYRRLALLPTVAILGPLLFFCLCGRMVWYVP